MQNRFSFSELAVSHVFAQAMCWTRSVGSLRVGEMSGSHWGKKRIGASERYERYIQHLWLVDWLRIYVKFQSRLRSACSWSKIISWWSRSPEARTNVVHRRSSRPWLGASSKQAVATPRRETRECPAQQLGSGRLRDWNDLRWWIGSIINMFFRWPCEMKKFRDTWIVSDCQNLDQSLVQVEIDCSGRWNSQTLASPRPARGMEGQEPARWLSSS